MTYSDNELKKVYSIRKLLVAFLIGTLISFFSYIIFGRADGGIFAIIISPFVSLYYTGESFVFAILAGLCLFNKVIYDFWYSKKYLYLLTAFLGLVGYIEGSFLADQAHYDFNDYASAQNYRDWLMSPSLVIILISLAYRPSKQAVVTRLTSSADTQ